MEKKIKFFFFGFGQTAKYLVKELVKSKKKFIFNATNTTKSKILSFDNRKFNSFKFKDDNYDKKLLKELQNSDYILVSIPPQKKQDLVLKKFSKFLINSNFEKLIYLSATSVYGDHTGRWVNENSKMMGKMGIYTIKYKSNKNLIHSIGGSRGDNGSLKWDLKDGEGVYTSIDIEDMVNNGYDIEILDGYYWQSME